MRKREELRSDAGTVLAIIISSALIIGGIWVLTSGPSKAVQQDGSVGVVRTLDMFRALSDQPRATLDRDATVRAEAIAEREASSTDCLTHVKRNDAQCKKVSTDGNTTVARCYVDAESGAAAIHHATKGQVTANVSGVGVAQNRGGCVYVAVETR